MLKSEELDQEGFEDIFRSAINQISEQYPAWTDYNSSDPGIAVLELMSWFTEVSRYHLNVIGREHVYRYLELLGYQCRGIIPAKTVLKVDGKGRLSRRSSFFAEEIPFETTMDLDVQDNAISYVRSGDVMLENQNHMLEELDSALEVFPFGKGAFHPEFEIGFVRECPQQELISLYVQIRHVENMAPVRDDFQELVTYRIEYHDGEWKKGVEIVSDETKGFLRSGILVFRITGEVKTCSPFRIRFVVESGEFSVLPAITGLVLNCVSARQQYTAALLERVPNADGAYVKRNCLVGVYGVSESKRVPVAFHVHHSRLRLDVVEGNTYESYEIVSYEESFFEERELIFARGICNLRVPLKDKHVLGDRLEIYVEEPDGLYYWSRVENFDCSDKYDRHYVYDADTAELVFGDGERGCPPRGTVLLTGYAVSYGMTGNVKQEMVRSDVRHFRAVNILPAVGGRDNETIEECYERVFLDRKKLNRCVTLKDYEQAVRNVPGFVAHRVHAFRKKDNEICVCVETEGVSKNLSNACLDNVKAYMLPKVPLGTKVTFLMPQYIGVHMYLDVSVNPSYQNAKQMTEEAVLKFFDSEAVGFGCLIKKNELGRYIYGLPWIRGIKSMEFSAAGGRAVVQNNGDIQFPDECLPVVEHVVVNVVELK